MAYDEFLAERIQQKLEERHIVFEAKKMFGGICYLVDDKMCLGIIKEKMMVRLEPEKQQKYLEKNGAREMDFTHRPMKGFLYIDPIGIDQDTELDYWITEALAYNPKAKKSKK